MCNTGPNFRAFAWLFASSNRVLVFTWCHLFSQNFKHLVLQHFWPELHHVHVTLVNACIYSLFCASPQLVIPTGVHIYSMNSISTNCNSVRNIRRVGSLHAPFSSASLQPVRSVARRVTRQTRRMAIFNGDIVADDKKTDEKTAAASSRGFAGLPEKPEDMRQSTPAASSFMQVSGLSNCTEGECPKAAVPSIDVLLVL